MLKVMRDSFQQLKWILIFVVVVFVFFTFVDFGAGRASLDDQERGSFAARVNGDTITVRDLSRAVYYTEQQYRQMYGERLTPEMLQAMNISQQMLDSLIGDQLLLQEAERLDLEASPAEIRKKVLEIPELSPNGKFVGAELYERYVTTRFGYSSAAEFEDAIAKSITLSKIESALSSSIVIPEKLAMETYKLQSESAKIRYVLYPAEKYMSSMTVTPAEVEAYYRASSMKYQHPEQRHVKYLLADVARLQSRINLSEQDLRQQYEIMKESFKSPDQVSAQHILIKATPADTPEMHTAAMKRAQDLVSQLRAGADFAKLAKEHSGDPTSAANGGDLGFFPRGQMVPQFEQTAFSLPPGQISDPVRTDYGYHIIKVNAVKPAAYRTFEEVRPELTLRVMDERAKTMARDRITQVKARAQQVGKPTDEDLRKLTDDVVSYNDASWFGKADSVTGLGRLPALNDWAFKATAGQIGDIIDTPRGPMVPYLVATRPAGISAFAEVKARVETDAKMAKARELAKQALTADLAAERSLDALGAKSGAAPMESYLSREGFVSGLSGDTQPLVTTALSANVGELKGPISVDQGAVVLQVLEQKKFDPKTWESEKTNFVQMMRTDEARKLRSTLLDRLRRDAKVEINSKAVALVGGAAA